MRLSWLGRVSNLPFYIADARQYQTYMLAELQLLNLVHHNISLDRILVSWNGHLVLSDFDSCNSEGSMTLPSQAATSTFWPPEWKERPMGLHRSSHSADVWSMGRVILQLYFHGRTNAGTIQDSLTEVAWRNRLLADLLFKVWRHFIPRLVINLTLWFL